jgi:dihydroxyacetone kinase-like predicted kinase
VERLERTFEASRAEATERFVSRLREQVAPVLEEARNDLQKLTASQATFKEESQAICRQVANQLESAANARLSETHDQLDKHSAAVVHECNEKLHELSQAFEKIAQDSTQAMIKSAAADAKKNLEDRAAEISGNFTGQLEAHIRSYLEFIGESIAEFPKKTSVS